jgi:hypothetical protein
MRTEPVPAVHKLKARLRKVDVWTRKRKSCERKMVVAVMSRPEMFTMDEMELMRPCTISLALLAVSEILAALPRSKALHPDVAVLVFEAGDGLLVLVAAQDVEKLVSLIFEIGATNTRAAHTHSRRIISDDQGRVVSG